MNPAHFVGLLDRAGADDDSRDAGHTHEQTGLGAEADFAVAVAAAELFRERDQRMMGRHVERRIFENVREIDPTARVGVSHPRLDLGLGPGDDRVSHFF